MRGDGFLTDPLLDAARIAHGFGQRDARVPTDLRRPVQVHGATVAVLRSGDAASLGEADAVVSLAPGVGIAVATADCVPILVAALDGRTVAAVHAGWRGLAAGVVEATVAALDRVGVPPDQLVAALGPRIGACCYEVDAPLIDALRLRHAQALDAALRPSRPGHARLDLGALVGASLAGAGVRAARVSALDACTRCDAVRFHSHRRDGSGAGRLVHWIAARAPTGAVGRRDP